MPSKNKDIVNNNKITINLSDVTKEKKEKKRRKKLRRRLLKKQEKELKQAKPAFSNFQYPAPVVVNAINPQQQKQLNLDYDKKLAQVLQTKFDEEYQKRENEKARSKPVEKPAEPIQENVGAFNAIDDGRGFSQTTDLLSKANTTYQTAQLNTESNHLYNKPFLSAIALPQDNIYNAEPVTAVKAQKEIDYFCPICGKGYRSEGALKNHILTNHPNQTPAKDEKQPDNKQTPSYNKNDFVVDFSDEYNLGTSPVKTIRYIKTNNQRSNTDASLFSSPKPTDDNNQRYNNASLDLTKDTQNDNNDITSTLASYNEPSFKTEDPIVTATPEDKSFVEKKDEPEPEQEPENPKRKSKTASTTTLSSIDNQQIDKQQKTDERKQLKATINQLLVTREDELHKAFKNKIQADAMIGSRTPTATLQKYVKFLQNAKKNGALSSRDFDTFK